MVLCIDEVYTARRIEYYNGKIVGLTEDGMPAKTVLAFMVQSLSSKYKDIVCLAPIKSLTTEKVSKYYFSIMEQLAQIMFVVAISVDNHPVNRSLYLQLSGGNN